MNPSICLMILLTKSTVYGSSPIAVCGGLRISVCTSFSGSVEREVVGVRGLETNLRLMQCLHSHFPVILGPLVIVGKITKALRLTCAKQWCQNVRFSTSCRDACPGVLSACRWVSSILVYSVDPWARSRTWSRINSPSTWSAAEINFPWRL